MKTITLLTSAVIALCIFSSCGAAMAGGIAAVSVTSSKKSTEPLSEEEVALLTKRVYSDHFNSLYPYLLERLQAKGCYISSSDKASGVITAEFIGIEKHKRYNRHLSFLLIERPTGDTEVRLTIYEDELYSDSSVDINIPTVHNVIQRGMVRDKSLYDYWFKALLES